MSLKLCMLFFVQANQNEKSANVSSPSILMTNAHELRKLNICWSSFSIDKKQQHVLIGISTAHPKKIPISNLFAIDCSELLFLIESIE